MPKQRRNEGAVRPRRDFDRLEARRQRAAGMFAAGSYKQAEIARKLGVSRTSVHRWYAAWRRGGSPALRKAGRAGRKPRLQEQHLELLGEALRAGARAFGFPTSRWTLRRMARVIERLTDVRHHPGHVWRIVRVLRGERPVDRPSGEVRRKTTAVDSPSERGATQW